MSTPVLPSAPASGDEANSDLFAELVVQHANMALIFSGAVPHPETGKPVQDFEAAQLFIDRLAMLEVKTRGNLSPEETSLLKQGLSTARMAFVQAVERADKPATPTNSAAEPQLKTDNTPSVPATPPFPSTPAEPAAAPATDATAAETDERKKFVKKY